MDLQKEREAFEKWAFQASEGWASFVKSHGDNYENDKLQFAWKAWQAAKSQTIPNGFVSVKDKLPTEGKDVIAFDAIKYCVFKGGEFFAKIL